MSKISIPTNFNIDLEFEATPFHIRMFSWIIDLVLLILYWIVAANLYGSIMGSGMGGYDMWAVQLLILVPLYLYHLVCEVVFNGQSLGKKLLGIRVVNDNGGKASFSQYMIRWLLRSSDLMIPIILILIILRNSEYLKVLWITVVMFIADLILIGTNKYGKRLGDLAAGTMLIMAKPKGNIEDTIFMEVEDSYIPAFPQVMRLSDRDINTIKGILDTGRKIGNAEMVENAAVRVKNVLAIQDQMSAFDFLDTLLKDYNYLSTKNS
ncbi:MAG: RDD family protein [Agriterribacter sp.]